MENNNMENNVELEVTPVASEEPVEQPVEAAPEAAPEVAPEVAPEENVGGPLNFLNKWADACRKGLDKFLAAYKQDPKKMGLFAGAAGLAVVALIVVLVLLIGSGNSYKTPINIMEDYANAKSYYNVTDQLLDSLNGFAEDEVEEILDLYMSTEDYEDNLEDAEAFFEESIEEMKEEYGSNYKYSYIIEEKEELDSDELRDFRDDLREVAENLKSLTDRTDDYDSDEWEDFADDMGFDGDKSKAREFISAVDDLRKVYKTAKVTDGYRLWVTIELDGSELDEPEEDEMEICVFKVNGRWVSENVRNLNIF